MSSIPTDVHRRRLSTAALFSLAYACASLSPAHAAPVVLEEVAQIPNVDPAFPFSDVIAIDGNDLFVCGVSDPNGIGDAQLYRFERQTTGQWAYRGVLASGSTEYPNNCRLAVRGGIGALVTGRGTTHILERTASGWVAIPIAINEVQHVAVQGRTVAIGSKSNTSVVRLFEKNASGNWVNTSTLTGPGGITSNEYLGPNLEFSPNSITAGNWSTDYQGDWTDTYTTYVFDRATGGWTRSDILERYVLGSFVIDNQIALRFEGQTEPGVLAAYFSRGSSGLWNVPHLLQTDEWFGDKRTKPMWVGKNLRADITAEGAGAQALAFVGSPFDDARGSDAGSVNVFTRSTQSTPPALVHAATLLASDARTGSRVGDGIATQGRRAVARGFNAPDPQTGQRTPKLYVFDVPSTLPASSRVQDNFEDANWAGWTPWGTSTWRVVASDGSQVFRQSNLQGDARAIFDTFSGPNQSIQADLKVNAFADPAINCWAGVMARYTDSRNFYYMLNSKQTLQIRKMVNGVHTGVATTPFTMQVGRNYRFRLETVGTRLRAYVDDKLMLDVRDTSLASGRAGLLMWKADTQYDNVVISTGPNAALHSDTFSKTPDEVATPPWTLSPASAWTQSTISSATVMRQSTTTGDARAVHGAWTGDQIITADIRPTSFHPEGGGFVGLMARYLSDKNYYYVLLTKSGKASLRRWWGGTITVLEEVSLPVTLGTSYKVRFEVIGNQLRLYVNGRLMAEGQDDTFESGRYGMVTYRAAADFDNFRASRP